METQISYPQMFERVLRRSVLDYEIAGSIYALKYEPGLIGQEIAQAAMADYEEYHHKITNGFPITLFLTMDEKLRRKFKVEKYHKVRFHIEELYD